MVVGRCRFHSGCGSRRIGLSTESTTRRTAAWFASRLRPAFSVSYVRPTVDRQFHRSGSLSVRSCASWTEVTSALLLPQSGRFGPECQAAQHVCDQTNNAPVPFLAAPILFTPQAPSTRSKGEGSNLDGSTGIRPFAEECLKLWLSRVHPSAVPQGSLLHSYFGLWKATLDQPPQRVLPQPDQLPF
jgi:hypothetical protein